MPAIIRLSRHGKKGQAFYHIVVADSRYARDARFIEKLGTYNPRTNPVTVSLKFDRTLQWIQKGVTKGVLTQELADAKFTKWVSEKETKVVSKKSSSEASKKDAYKKRFAVETTARENRNAKRKAKEAAEIGR